MSASPDYKDFTWDAVQLNTIEKDLTFTLGPVPLPISNLDEIWFTAKRNDNEADPGIFQVTKTGGGIVATDDPNGEARLTIPATATAALVNITTLLCDIKTLETSGRVYTEAKGKLTIRPGITDAIV